MATENSTWPALALGVERRTDERNTFVIERARAHVLALGPGHFFERSALLLPTVRPAPTRRQEAVHTGLGLLAHAFVHAAEHADQKLLIVGHAPAAGDEATALSTLRAGAVHAILTGSREGFVNATRMNQAEDQHAILNWAAAAHGYPCEVSPELDSVERRAALRRFRETHNERFGVELAPEPVFADDDFGAVYDLYELSLAELLDTDVEGLSGKRSALVLQNPEQLGCGSAWTNAAPPQPAPVDLIFFEPSPAPPSLARDKTPGESLYRDERFVRRAVIEPPDEPITTCVRMRGLLFNTNKSFLLPSAMDGIHKLVALYEEHPVGEVLIVGHTDTSGDPSYNDPLSLERAEAVAAYLTDDVEAWLAWYDKGKPKKKRWGPLEDEAMLGELPDGATHMADPEPFKSYQRSRGLGADGICGPNTRRQLITDYMALDGTTLPAGLTPVAHGCGENFPSVAPEDGKNEALDRRVEIFVFDDGIDPPPPGSNSGPGSTEYPTWRRRCILTIDLSTDAFEYAFSV